MVTQARRHLPFNCFCARQNCVFATSPAGYVFRAKLILMLAEGSSFNAIKRQLQTTAPTIVRWKQRFRRYGLEGLDTYHPGQKPSVLTPALRARILSATRRKPSDGSTHWSCRKLASALGVSKDAVYRVWQEAGLKPHRLERYMASDDPEFESKAADILGLYLRPPQHAAVFCVDEKTAIQALDRLDPVLPLSIGDRSVLKPAMLVAHEQPEHIVSRHRITISGLYPVPASDEPIPIG